MLASCKARVNAAERCHCRIQRVFCRIRRVRLVFREGSRFYSPVKLLIPLITCLLFLLPGISHGASDIYGPKPFDQILTSSFSTNWTASNATAVSGIANLKHVILLDAATKTLCLSIDTSNGRNSGLTVTPAGNITTTYGSAMRCMFQMRDINTEILKTTPLNGNYSIHPELFSYSAIDGNATANATTASSTLVRDIKSIYQAADASYLVFTFVGNATSTKIKAATRLVLSSGNFSTSGTWSASQWVMMNGTSVSLTANEANATSFYLADATKLINFEIASGSDFNPNRIPWQTNAFAANPTNPPPWTFSNSTLISTANNGLIKTVDPAYSAQLNHSANATAAAATALENIRISLAANGESLRYDKEVYLAFRENALSHLFASGDIYNGQVGNRTVAHVYFTNAANATTGIRHPYMVIATHNATPRPNFLVDVARPPGDGVGSGYANQTITRTAVLEARTIVVPLKDYGQITTLTENTVSPSLASIENLSAGNYTAENYAGIASVGIAIDGVKIYPAINNTLAYAPAAGEITSSGAHVGQGGSLHWHADGHGFNGNGINLYNLADYSNSQGNATTHPPIIGFSYDGIAIYGKYEGSFNSMEGYSLALDEYGGHSHGDYGYHYHAHAKQIENGSNDFKQHFLMVGAWKGKINTLPVMGEAEINIRPPETVETTQRYVGRNGTASTIPVVLPATINGTVYTILSTSVTAAYSPTSYAIASGTLPTGLSLNATTGAISGTPTSATVNSTVVSVRATNTSGNGTGNLTFTIAKGNQTISGVAPTLSLATGAAAYSLNASVSSNLTLSYSSSNTSVATVASNGTVTVVGAGSTILTVSQAGNSNYDPASSVTQTLTVTSASPLETWKTAYFGANASDSSLSGLSADPDADGYTNAYEFAFGGNPLVSGASSTTSVISNGNFTFSFQKRRNASDATYEVRMLSDLSLGFASGNLITPQTSSPQPGDIGTDYEQVEAVIPTSTSKGFLRVQATVP